MKRAIVLTMLLAGCAGVPSPEPGFADPGAPNAEVQEPLTPKPAEPAVLYARDGTPVSAVGTAPRGGALDSRQIGEGSGRMYILELYQNVIEERDTLSAELAALSAELERMRLTLLEADGRIAALEGRIEALSIERQQLVDENLDLAARLTTAQIRRLQAEKILLEKSLAELRETTPVAAASGDEPVERP